MASIHMANWHFQGRNGPVRAKVDIWHLQKCYICILIFHKDHFKTIPSFLGVVQKLAFKTHVVYSPDIKGFGPVQTKVGIWQLQKCYICIFIFHKDHFKTIPSFLRGLVQKLALKTHVFHVFDLCVTFGPHIPGSNEVRGAQNFFGGHFMQKLIPISL